MRNKLFPFIIFLSGLAIGLIIVRSYSQGSITNNNGKNSTAPTLQISPNPTELTSELATDSFTAYQAPNQFYRSFKFTYPIDWQISEDKTNDYQNITISKNDFKIQILRGNTGGEGCSIDKDPGAGIDLRGTKYTKFENKIGKFLYFRSAESYIICGPYQDKSDEYVTLTTIGLIRMTGSSDTLLKEAVAILKSLEYTV